MCSAGEVVEYRMLSVGCCVWRVRCTPENVLRDL